MANFTRAGYGQVELNQMSAQKNGAIYASLPLDEGVKVLQNGEFMFYDYSTGEVTATPGVNMEEPFLVYNEIKLYEPFWRTTLKDFAMIRVGDNYVTSAHSHIGQAPLADPAKKYGDGSTTAGVDPNPAHTSMDSGYRMDGIAPRLFKTAVGDVMTTNMVETGVEYDVKDLLSPEVVTAADGGKTLVLKKVVTGTTPTYPMRWVVAKVYTMPDGQPGLKLQRIA